MVDSLMGRGATLQSPSVADGARGQAPARAQGIDEAGFVELFRVEFHYVCNTLRRFGVRPGDLSDKAHDVFVAVFERRADFDPSRPARPWLCGFAYRVAADHRRNAWTRRAVFDDTAEPAPDVADPGERLDAARNRALVLAALETIELDRRVVFVMSDLDGVSAPEVAAALSIPLGTVYSRLRLAREDFSAAVKRLRLKRGER